MAAHNKVAIVTGAGTGIGKAVALAMLKASIVRLREVEQRIDAWMAS